MLELIEVHTSRLIPGQPEHGPSCTWINPQHIVRIDPCDTRGNHDSGELAMILELTNGNELYVPIIADDEIAADEAVSRGVRDLLLVQPARPLAAFEIK